MRFEQELEGRTYIVTGASRGIGRATAIRLAAKGASLVLTGRDVSAGQSVVDEIEALGQTARFVVADQGQDSDWVRLIDETLSAFSRVDGLVANAGIAVPAPIAHLDLEGFRHTNQVNLKGCFLGLKHVTQALRQHGEGGSIVLIASIIGKIGAPAHAHYAAAKGGVRLMAKAAALELGPEKIRVNSVHPGMVKTQMTAGFDEAMVAPAIPLKRFGLPQEIAETCLFLVSDRSKFMTGAEMVVDGGWIAQ